MKYFASQNNFSKTLHWWPESRKTHRNLDCKPVLWIKNKKEMEKPTSYESEDHLNLKATELRLGLPGRDESDKQSSSSVRNNKRASSEMEGALDVENEERDCAPPRK